MTSLIDQRFRQRLRDAPETPVLVSPRATLGPTDIDDAAQRFAATLAARGIGPGDRVAIVGRGAGFLCLWLATLRRQAAPVLVDIATPLDEQRRIAAVLGARAIAGVNAPVDELVDAPWIVEVPLEVRLEVPATSRSSPSDPLEPPLEAIKLTSGSTGAPRGILCSGAALLADEAQIDRDNGPRQGGSAPDHRSPLPFLRPLEPGPAGARPSHHPGGPRHPARSAGSVRTPGRGA